MIDTNNLVTQSNALNEMRRTGMSLQQMRFFHVYLSRIYKDRIETRKVRFELNEFIKIMGLNPTTSIAYLKGITENLLQVVLTEPTGEAGQYRQYQMFRECEVTTDEIGRWYVTVDAHEKVVPYLFEYQNKYFSYELWNTVRLTSTNQIRMYEILKQYERTSHKTLTITLEDLKYKLGIEPNEYSRWENFKTRVILPCQKALKEKTDICFDYEPVKNGKAVVAIKFTFFTNDKYEPYKNTINEYIDSTRIIKKRDDFETEEEYREYCSQLPQEIQDSIIANEKRLNAIEEMKEDVNFGFTEVELDVIYDHLCQIFPESDTTDFKEITKLRRERLRYAYNRFRVYSVNNEVPNKLSFINKVLEDEPKEARRFRGNNLRRTGKEAGITLDKPVEDNKTEGETKDNAEDSDLAINDSILDLFANKEEEL